MSSMSVCCALKDRSRSRYFQVTRVKLHQTGPKYTGDSLFSPCTNSIQGQLVDVSYIPVPPFVIRLSGLTLLSYKCTSLLRYLTLRTSDPKKPRGIEPSLLELMLAKFKSKTNITLTILQTKIDPKTGKFDQGAIRDASWFIHITLHTSSILSANLSLSGQVFFEQSQIGIGTKGLEYVNMVINEVSHLNHVFTFSTKLVTRAPVPRKVVIRCHVTKYTEGVQDTMTSGAEGGNFNYR